MTSIIIAVIVAAGQIATGTIRGVVLDTRGGVPLRRVSVRLQKTERVTETDDDGRFEIAQVPAGDQELYVSAVDFILVKRAVGVKAGETSDVTIVMAEGTGTYTETVNVVGAAPARDDPASPAAQTLRGNELQQLTGVLANDPMRAVQAMPGVVANDDLRSEFSIRGAGVEHTNFVFEGMSTDFLLHTARDLRGGASIAMINGDVLDGVDVANGSYPQQHGNRIGADVDFRMREGSRDRVKSSASVSLIDASAIEEGPIGTDHRGSWLVSGRASYVDFVARRLYPTQPDAFGFDDAQAKLAFDVNSHQHLQFAIAAGRSQFDRSPDDTSLVRDVEGTASVAASRNRSAIAVLSWRYQPSSRVSLTERLGVDVNAFENTSIDASQDNGGAHDVVWRTEWSYAQRAGVAFEGGGEARWSAVSGHQLIAAQNATPAGVPFSSLVPDDFSGSTIGVSAFAQARLTSSSGARIVPGIRIDHWSLTSDTSACPWIDGAVPLSRTLTLRGGGGIYRQQPGIAELRGFFGNPGLTPERAYDADLAIEGRLGASLRWQITAYNREDRGLLDPIDLELRFLNGRPAPALPNGVFENALDGYARGVELMIERRSPNGLSGWVSYALGYNHYVDRTTGDAFWGDFDQRHTVNMYVSYRASGRLSVNMRFRAGSNLPTPGFWTERNGLDFVGDSRNTQRVPVYSRLDARVNRSFQWSRARLTLSLEALNVYNRVNVRPVVPGIDLRTFQASPLYETLLPFVPSIGVRLEF